MRIMSETINQSLKQNQVQRNKNWMKSKIRKKAYAKDEKALFYKKSQKSTKRSPLKKHEQRKSKQKRKSKIN